MSRAAVQNVRMESVVVDMLFSLLALLSKMQIEKSEDQ